MLLTKNYSWFGMDKQRYTNVQCDLLPAVVWLISTYFPCSLHDRIHTSHNFLSNTSPPLKPLSQLKKKKIQWSFQDKECSSWLNMTCNDLVHVYYLLYVKVFHVVILLWVCLLLSSFLPYTKEWLLRPYKIVNHQRFHVSRCWSSLCLCCYITDYE